MCTQPILSDFINKSKSTLTKYIVNREIGIKSINEKSWIKDKEYEAMIELITDYIKYGYDGNFDIVNLYNINAIFENYHIINHFIISLLDKYDVYIKNIDCNNVDIGVINRNYYISIDINLCLSKID